MRTVPDRAFESQRWAGSGDSWNRWADVMADAAERINRPLLEAVGLCPGDRMLDLASGAGEPALTAAAMAGPDGHVVATDLVEPMLAGARRRAQERQVPLAFALADMEALPFAAASFDRITCRFGLMFVPRADRAVAEMARVLRPGGRAGVVVWGPLAENTLFQELDSVVNAELGPDPAGGLATLFRFAESGSTATLLTAGGLCDAAERPLRQTAMVPANRPFWRPTLEMGFAPRLEGLSTEARDALERRISARFLALAGPDGTVRLDIHARLGTATA